MKGETESTRKTFAAKLAVSGKKRTWITGDRRATGPSNIHAFNVQSGFVLACLKIALRLKAGHPCKDEGIGDLRMVPKPRSRGIGH